MIEAQIEAVKKTKCVVEFISSLGGGNHGRFSEEACFSPARKVPFHSLTCA